MATRRRYKNDPPIGNVAAMAAPAPHAAPEAPDDTSAGGEPNPLQDALEAQAHAEWLRHQHHAAHAAHHAAVDALGLNAHKTAMLKQHPDMLRHGTAIQQHYANAIAAGVPDDSPEMDAHMVRAMHHEIAKHHGAAPPQPAPPMQHGGTPDNRTTEELADELEREHAALLAENQPPPPPAKRKSFPMSAPVSRDFSAVSGNRQQENTLRADERQIARVSFPHLSPPQAEYEYLKNKRRMIQMKANGQIQGDR